MSKLKWESDWCDKAKQINLEHKEILPDMATVLPHAFFLNMTTSTET